MNLSITPGKLGGTVTAIPSKSHAHRALICAAFSERPTELYCPVTNTDIACTVQCLNSLGADIRRTDNGYRILPATVTPQKADLSCAESGSTLRFLLPVAGALGTDATFHMSGRLPDRPLSPLWEEMERMGCTLTRPSGSTLRCQGKLRPGAYRIAGNISSQFVTGLLFAASLMDGDSEIKVTGKLESRPYVDMTRDVMASFGMDTENLHIKGGQGYKSPGTVLVEGDWSNSAFFLAAQALGSDVTVTNLNPNSSQGDRAVVAYLSMLEENCVISAADVPDLIPVLSIVAGAKKGAVFTDIGRLRLKESDRVNAIISMVEALGGKAEADENTLTVHGTGFSGGIVNSVNDHRIAMSAAIAATVCSNAVTILNAEAVNKSYPLFWEDYRTLGGNYEQYLR